MARVWSISSALVPVCGRGPFLRAFTRRGCLTREGALSSPSLPPPLSLNLTPNPTLTLNPSKGFLRNFSANAVNESGVESPLIAGMEKKIKEQLKAEAATVKDLSGDGRHVSIQVVSECFQGQSKVNRHRMVYKAISEELEGAVHAVDYMETKTPAEASQ